MMNLIGLLLCILECTLESTSKPSELVYNSKKLEFVIPSEKYCFDRQSLIVESIYKVNGYTSESNIIQNIASKENTKDCFKIPKYFTFILLKDNNNQKMILINNEWKRDYVVPNFHVKEVYFKHEFECFGVTTSHKAEFMEFLKDFSSEIYSSDDDITHCIIFDKSQSIYKQIIVDGRKITVNFQVPKSAWGETVKNWNDCTASTIVDDSQILSKPLEMLPDDRSTICYNPKQYSIDGHNLDSISFIAQKSKNCKKIITNEKYCLFFDSGFKYFRFKSVGSKSDMFACRQCKTLGTELSVKNKVFCTEEQHIQDKTNLLIGYYSSSSNMHCIWENQFYGSIQELKKHGSGYENLQLNTAMKCSIDPYQKISTGFAIPLEDGKKSICVNREFSILVELKSNNVNISPLSQKHIQMCSVILPTKICYYFIVDIQYAILRNQENSKKTIISNKNTLVNEHFDPDYLYHMKYNKYHVLCIPESKLKDANTFKSQSYYITSHEDKGGCLLLTKIPSHVQIILNDFAGCKENSISMNRMKNIYHGQNDIPSDENTQCEPLYKPPDSTTPVIKIETIPKILGCLKLTCTLITHLFLFLIDSNTQVHEKLVSCQQSTADDRSMHNTLTKRKYLIVYKVHNSNLNLTHRVTDSMLLPEVIKEDYARLYKHTYTSSDAVCIRRDVITNFNEDDQYELKSDKIVCHIVELMKENKTIEINNIFGCKQKINFAPDAKIDSTTYFSNSRCEVFIRNNGQINLLSLPTAVMNNCPAIFCNTVLHVVETDNNIQKFHSSIVDCKETPIDGSCRNLEKNVYFMMLNVTFIEKKISYSFNQDISITINKHDYYKPAYNQQDFVCFDKKKLYYDAKWNGITIFDTTIKPKTTIPKKPKKGQNTKQNLEVKLEPKNDQNHICVFPRYIEEEITVYLQVNKYINKTIVFKPINTNPPKESWEGKCNEFVDTESKSSKPSIKKLEDVTECLTKLGIVLEYMVTEENDLKDCESTNCYIEKEFKYIKAKSQYNDKEFFILPASTYSTLESQSDINSYYLSGYSNLDIVCVPDIILIDSQKDVLSDGVASFNSDKSCYFVKLLKDTRKITINMKETCSKDVMLYMSDPKNEPLVELMSKEDKCINFAKRVDKANHHLTMSDSDLIECKSMTCLNVLYLVKGPKGDIQVLRSFTKASDKIRLSTENLNNFEYVKVNNIFTNEELFITSSRSIDISIPDKYLYLSSYYRDEVVCFHSKHIKNRITLDESELYNLGDKTCFFIGTKTGTLSLEIAVGDDCARTINLYHDKLRKDDVGAIEKEELCQSFITQRNTVNSISLKDMRTCLKQTCSKVVKFVEIPNTSQTLRVSEVTRCESNDFSGGCLEDGKEYDFIEVTNSYITGSVYYRTLNYVLSMPDQKTIHFYEPTYGGKKIICMERDLVKEINTFERIIGAFLEDQRMCVLTSKLSQDLKVKYKVNDECDLSINLKHTSVNEELSTGIPVNSMCNSFISMSSRPAEVLKITRDQLLNCPKFTCSTIKQLITPVKPSQSSSKQLLTCDTIRKLEICMDELENADAIEISSPFHSHKFHVSLKESSSFQIPPKETTYYEDVYYSDEIMCLENSILADSKLNLNSKGIIKYGEKICIIVKDLQNEMSFNINLFTKCQKTVVLKPNDPLSNRNSQSNCLLLHDKNVFQTKSFTKSTLKSCIEKTCSKLEYLVVDMNSSSKLEKSVTVCTSPFGDSSCIEDSKSYYFAKLTIPSRNMPVYLTLDAINTAKQGNNNNYFYKSKYYSDKVVCFKRAYIQLQQWTQQNTFNVGSLMCIVNRELDVEMSVSVSYGQCNRVVLLKKTAAESNEQHPLDGAQCNKFLSKPTSISEVTTIDYSTLEKCLKYTCSSLVGAVEINADSTNTGISKYTKCPADTKEGDHCLESEKNYGFIKIHNSFIDSPIYFRTIALPKPNKASGSRSIFYHSSYSQNDVVCFIKSDLEMDNNNNNVRGIFTDEEGSCIVGSELEKDISVQHKISNECSRKISFTKVTNQRETQLDLDLEKKCEVFLKSSSDSSTPQFYTPDILLCLERTCSTITSIKSDNQDQVTKQNDCTNLSSPEECLNNAKNKEQIFISSPFINSPVKIINIYNDEMRLNSAKLPRYYETNYHSDQVLCIRKSDLSNESEIKNLQMTTEMGDKHCILIDKETGDTSISVKQFGKCDLTINLHPKSNSVTENSKSQKDDCRSFYDGSSEPHKLMTLDKLKQCVQSTCSKIKYFVGIEPSKTSPVFETQKCSSEPGQYQCLDDANTINFLKISNEASDVDIIVTIDPINRIQDLSYSNHYYKQSFFKNEVACFPDSTLVNPSLFGPTVSFGRENYKCIVASELSELNIIEIQTKSGCKRKILILNTMNSKSHLQEDEKCHKFIAKPSKVKSVQYIDATTLETCLTQTCSVVESAVEIDSDKPFMQSKRIECSDGSNCLQTDKKYDFVKVKIDHLQNHLFFRTFDFKDEYLPKFPFAYKNSFHKDDVACFQNEKLPTKSDGTSIDDLFEESKRSCLLVSEVKNGYNIKVPITDNCNHNIIVSVEPEKAEFKDQSEDMQMKCNSFYTNSMNSMQMDIISKINVIECVKYTCSKIDYFVNLQTGHDSYSTKTHSSCTSGQTIDICLQDVNHFENMQISSPFLDSPFYVRSQADTSDNSRDSKKTQYLDSYSNAEIVCIHDDLFVLPSNLSFIKKFRKNNANCIVVKDLPPDTTIQILQYGHCEKTIKFNPTLAAHPVDYDECKGFYIENEEISQPMELSKLKRCIKQTCSKVEYYVSNKDLSDQRVKSITECVSDYGDESCIQNEEGYQIVKISNPSRKTPFMIKVDGISNSVPSKSSSSSDSSSSSSSSNYFYRTDYFEEEVVCLQTDVISGQSSFSTLNSYSFNHETCIIVKEFSENKNIVITSNACQQTLNIRPKASRLDKTQANALYNKCAAFIKPKEHSIHSISFEDLKKCLTFTCSTVESYQDIFEVSENVMIGKVSICSTEENSGKCLETDKVYDYVKVNSKFVTKPVYFRTGDETVTLSQNSIQKVFYKERYYKNDIVCFETKLIKNPRNFQSMDGFIVNGQKTCMIAKDLNSDVDIQVDITSTCSKKITILHHQSVEPNPDDSEKTCTDFISESENVDGLPTYNSVTLATCLRATCSKIVGYVIRDNSQNHFISKNIIPCSSTSSDIQCLAEITEYEAMEIISPLRKRSFYIQSSDTGSSSKELFVNAKYTSEYYQDQVVCAHKELANFGNLLKSTKFYKKDNSYCLIVKESDDGDSFSIKLHGHCHKTINLIPSRSSSEHRQSPLVNQCKHFYPNEKVITLMNIKNLRDCVEFTCSQIEYYSNEYSPDLPPSNKIMDCGSEFGRSDCITDKTPYVVKIKNPISSHPQYVILDIMQDVYAQSLVNIFYKDEYNNDELVCFRRNMIDTGLTDSSITTYNSIKCFVGRDQSSSTATTTITLMMIDGCKKVITIKKNDRKAEEPPQDFEECMNLITNRSQADTSVFYLPIKTLTRCIRYTCSRVDLYAEVIRFNDISSSQPLSKCNAANGDSSCLTISNNYDFVKISNSFISNPILYRTFDQEEFKRRTSSKDIPLFYSSEYSEDELACFENKDVLNMDKLNDRWIYKEDLRTCVLGSDVKSKTEVKIQVKNDCSRVIKFNPKSLSESYDLMKENDAICRPFYDTDSGNIAELSFDQLKYCLSVSCSTIKKPEIKSLYDSCLSSETEKCTSQIKSLRIEVSSSYRKDPILVISKETSSRLDTLRDDPSKYALIYENKDIPCLASESISSYSNKIFKYERADNKLKCFKFEPSDTEGYIVAKDKSSVSGLIVYGQEDINDQLQSAYSVQVNIYTFESELQQVSQSVSATIPFAALEQSQVDDPSSFKACILAKHLIDPIVTSNYSSFMRGYTAIIPKNHIFSSNFTFLVRKSQACGGYLKDSSIEMNHKEHKYVQAEYECLPVFNGYLALKLNSLLNRANLTENLGSKCVSTKELESTCSKTHAFSDYITMCYAKEMTPEEEEKLRNSKNENKYNAAIANSLNIHVYLRNGECFTKKITLSQRVGFCEIIEGFVSVSLFSYESFTRTVVRKSMINNSYESTLAVAIIFAVGLMLSFGIRHINKPKKTGGLLDYRPPLTLVESIARSSWK